MTRNWFTRMCRRAGLAIHDATHPSKKREINRKVEEEKINEKVTLRRTTIDEVEIRENKDS